MSDTMIIPNRSEKRTRYHSRPCRKLARAMMNVWPSAEALSYDLADAGIYIVPRTAQKWRNGETGPSGADIDTVRDLVRQQIEQQIMALNAHVKAVCGGSFE